MKNTLITIVGATAIGKTALSIKLAQHFGCDIISCDSRQFYKEMSIGTAVPDTEELASATHHFIQNRSIFEDYSVGQFEKDALTKLDELFLKNPIQIMVGGSGLYVDAALKGLDYFPDVDSAIRVSLTKELEEKGIEHLQSKLKDLDPETYNSIAIDNPHRLIRALEICIGTNKTYSSFKNKPKTPRNFQSIKIGLTADREIMYNRINQRVDIMMNNGLLEEAKKLHPHKKLNALQTVGYRELFEYFDGNFTKEFAVEEIKKNTRRFAKRQGTWFRKDKSIIWFDFQDDIQHIIQEIENKI
ncbi:MULTISPECIES: tRNA (adenosine(37)-N6)-dimethylallyltransferase MiaA [unclassified Tenacibaculum]|uniref:tRNA (adenosine(37)-N6)-dimethylallyltransferase MiaA n=1 Tax=unclassified Tenacibaculum TaxID=2635139 RepID=UPI001EFF6A41|nr:MULTISPECIES: tRNA (adenosine(37)-N6)-dimethylallyltransferase MiaA [unclassified Tenacibaculum]MCF2874237.1 tRNA (adenosine(37)-N6)-dimethylallyltransferase MiaA [Tenacibaculum sp. Cn5-1]MCF2934818.1 tRNA (adenosine(37)-N6)-dimethylallyltransferase MiaA [Tenacibaculum sp. Cn5-34]MCG7511028.1 tRNA (adenosine(37)-N6)-dimethylallyltransferase MiaA [Tenacibaculum sp. Cn5-46]